MRLNKRHVLFALGLLALAWVVAACGPVDVTMPDGSTQRIPYDAWLATSEAEINLTKVQVAIGTFTPTPTPPPTLTPTTTATLTPIPTNTPIPTATPFTGYFVVDNKAGEVIHQSEFQPECGGQWGYPGMDVWRVEYGQLVQKICSTPWNRPQNMAIKVVGYVAMGFGVFIAILIGASELRKFRLARARKAAQQQNSRGTRELTAPQQTALSRGDRSQGSRDEISEFIRTVAAVDGGLAKRLHAFRKDHRDALRGIHTVESFSEQVELQDESLFSEIEAALQRAARSQRSSRQ